ncbi:hypothetical protein HGM15179_003981 [Zosterops borbonicus]|uniref:Co-chaperone HscB C-terminal oligomerisation domain-containing protein n=1 Tax=Zosterops borbonicus TaxID=364589 RepID=A0A8K1GQY0_9PASS|nr:hypothetical protein HGM15179_003981 [Zosterops borbonicus]
MLQTRMVFLLKNNAERPLLVLKQRRGPGLGGQTEPSPGTIWAGKDRDIESNIESNRIPGTANAAGPARWVHVQTAVDPNQKEQHYSEQHSSLINKAYQTLLNPLSRGLYLLELSGVEPVQETDCDADSAFLMEIMEINEKLAEAKNEDSLEETETLIKVKQEELTKEVTAAFERDDLEEAKKLLAKMKYFANLEDKLKAKKVPS